MKSMTGYTCSSFQIEKELYRIEISSLNRKIFEFSLALPKEWASLERQMQLFTKKFVERGKLCVSIRREIKSNQFDLQSIQNKVVAFKTLCNALGVECVLDSQTILKLSENSLPNLDEIDTSAIWNSLQPIYEKALKDFDLMRQREGESLKGDLLQRLAILKNYALQIESKSANMVENYSEKLLARLNNMNLQFDMKDTNVLREIAIFADRSDISEELIRIKSHIAQFEKIINEQSAIGRKLDFLCQELGREINTLSSKCADIECVKIALDFKNELERIREQVQNVE